MQYAPSKYPGLADDIMTVLESMLGSAESKPLIDDYRQKLRSSTASSQKFASQPQRQTPRYLRIIATRDDNQKQRLKAEWKGDVGVMRWESVERYLGSVANVVGTA